MILKHTPTHCFFIFIFLLPIVLSCHTRQLDPFNEADYTEVSRGPWLGYFAITLENKYDTSRKIRVLYNDSTKSEVVYSKYFFRSNLMDGPYYFYGMGKLFKKGFMKNDKLDGEELTYGPDSILVQRSFYNEGKKIGVWETYTSYGNLSRKTYYDQSGKFIKLETFDRNGKLSRTEFEE